MISYWQDSPCGGHGSTSKIAAKVLQVGFFWPFLFQDVHHYVRDCVTTKGRKI